MPNPILISIEGDIGAGKSTLIEQLKQQHPKWHFIDEPVGYWTSLKKEDGSNLLENFYKDTDRYAYTFQNCAVLTRAMEIQRAVELWRKECEYVPSEAENNVFVTERCLETDFHVFAKMMYDDGKLNKIEWDLYKMWYDYVQLKTPPLSGIVYLDTPAEICKERIQQRNRKGEENIPLAYLENLERYHKTWLFDSQASVPLLAYRNYGSRPHKVSDIGAWVNSAILPQV